MRFGPFGVKMDSIWGRNGVVSERFVREWLQKYKKCMVKHVVLDEAGRKVIVSRESGEGDTVF